MRNLNWRGIWAIVNKDLRVIRRTKMVWMPMLILPILFTFIMPLLVGVLFLSVPQDSPEFMDMTGDLGTMLLNAPQNDAFFASLTSDALKLLYLVYLYMFAPFFLMIPIMTGSVVAADSFAGEKERKTLEALLHTPLSDFELYLSKWLSPLVAGVMVSLVSAVLYGIVVNGVGLVAFGQMIFPNWAWIIMLIWLVPVVTGLSLGITVWVSSRVSTFMEAYQAGAFAVLPFVLLFVGQMAGVLYFDVIVTVIIGLVVWLIDAFLFWLGGKQFSRGAILSRLS